MPTTDSKFSQYAFASQKEKMYCQVIFCCLTKLCIEYESNRSQNEIFQLALSWTKELMPEADVQTIKNAFREHHRNCVTFPRLAHIINLLPTCRSRSHIPNALLQAEDVPVLSKAEWKARAETIKDGDMNRLNALVSSALKQS